MNKKGMRAMGTALMLALAVSVFYLTEEAAPEKMTIPVTQVFSVAQAPENTLTPLQTFRTQREEAREVDINALTQLAQNGDAQAEEYLLEVISRHETEAAIESALAAKGFAGAVCALREDAAVVCLPQKADAQSAQTVLEICQALAQVGTENVFLLDECGYSW